MKNEKSEQLCHILENVNSWLHFTEAKNAALIAFNIALLAALMSSELSNCCVILFSSIIIGLLISTVISLHSFKPVNTSLKKTDGSGLNINLLHYAYIASLESDEYLINLYKFYWKEPHMDIALIPQIERDYSEEIVQNSRITIRKQSCFEKAFYIDISMIFAIMIQVICA